MSERRPGAGTRAAAARVVAAVVRDGVSADDALARAGAGPDARDEDRDGALIAALALGALRWHPRLEWQAAQLLTRPLPAGREELAALLRIGLLQLQHFRIPDHAAVSATVDAVALLGQRNAGGLVNAVLRRFQRERALLDARAATHEPARFSHPQWLIDRVRADWPADWQAILAANNEPGPMWLRVNLRRTSRESYLDDLRRRGLDGAPAADLPAAVRLTAPVSTADLPGFADGFVSVQDAAAQLAAGYLALAPGQRVLDACAAPGGKTGHILETCADLAEVWALDRNAARLDKVRANQTRLGLTARLVHGDAAAPESWWDGRLFDRILIDAPCSATGVIRRHPDIKLRRTAADVARAAGRQAALLTALWPLLKPGGRLVYATCSVLAAENRDRIATFAAALPMPGGLAFGPIFERQILPGEAQMDGFYYACLDKPGALRSSGVSLPQQ